MSDLLSPILFVMNSEAQAYVCFCGLMVRMQDNFCRDGTAMSIKFKVRVCSARDEAATPCIPALSADLVAIATGTACDSTRRSVTAECVCRGLAAISFSSSI